MQDTPAESRGADAPGPMPFAAPWEAQAFALVVLLAERGVIGWPEWARALAAEEADDGAAPYYARWLTAAEKLLVAKGLTSFDQLAARRFAIGVGDAGHAAPGSP
jgi:nitrile hydratase accessory protein